MNYVIGKVFSYLFDVEGVGVEYFVDCQRLVVCIEGLVEFVGVAFGGSLKGEVMGIVLSYGVF